MYYGEEVDVYDSTDSESSSEYESPPPPPPPPAPLTTTPRLTLVLPPLQALKKEKEKVPAKKSKSSSSKAKSKSKSKQPKLQPFGYADYADASTSQQKIPRPVKLKPLKEVLTRLVTQLKKKDDYAFFLKPVNPAAIPGYADVIKRPMDLGTMTAKVQRGRYRSLEDFTSDFRLVTSNAKTFNPPGNVYYVEADRLETWGLEQISKVSSTVIQYETDWNIEIEKDDAVAEDDVEDFSMAVDPEPIQERSRSPSVSVLGGSHPATLRRGLRGPYNRAVKETTTTTVSDGIDAEGRLPGSKDGLGAFPPGSDLARTMLYLKLKGKRYKTKKERLRIEKEGPPYFSDGSLAYTEVEDPFSFFSALVPDPLTRPQLIPIYPPPTQANSQFAARDTSTTPAPTGPVYPLPTLVPSSHPEPPPLPTVQRHWTINRSGTRRGRDDVPLPASDDPEEHAREAHALDYGSLAVLAGELVEEMRRRGEPLPEGLEEADTAVKSGMRTSLELPIEEERLDNGVYWSENRALEGEEYVRDLVYGGVDGLAYVRSLAEFVGTAPLDVGKREEDEDVDMDAAPSLSLGMPLAEWVAENVVGPLTQGRHALLQRTALELTKPTKTTTDDKIPARVSAALNVHPRAAATLSTLRQIYSHQLDMASLIRSPAEVEQSEKEWAGKDFKASGPTEMNTVLDYAAGVIKQIQAERAGTVKVEAADTGESALVRNLRLNLLALVKRAPVDAISRLPADLVPEELRHIVPTLGAIPGLTTSV
ncbi:hypothetical protein FB45DRAFT_905108 [Roridomyces roridus]|uniref:Bromo domain-containing protein n=1 Tax=Roridomyces roridus TaxID=1738132 RepID=A0AAD7C584_9AGAR|nr:hypothetical protein FB45DRAFT_905108 [Roridomyces roridus]